MRQRVRKSYEPYVPTTHNRSPLNLLPTEGIGNLQGANEVSPRSREMKLRKNEMKLRKKQIKVPKNFLIPR